jgi:hypothetical protein
MSWYIVRFERYGRIIRYLAKFKGEILRRKLNQKDEENGLSCDLCFVLRLVAAV